MKERRQIFLIFAVGFMVLAILCMLSIICVNMYSLSKVTVPANIKDVVNTKSWYVQTKMLRELRDADLQGGLSVPVDENNTTFVTLTNTDKRAYITINGNDLEISYDVSEETKEDISEVVKLLCGDDADYKISDTYTDYVEVYCQGKKFLWKDGRLELANE